MSDDTNSTPAAFFEARAKHAPIDDDFADDATAADPYLTRADDQRSEPPS